MRGLLDYRFAVELPGGCNDGPLLASGHASVEYCVEPADREAGIPHATYDCWVADLTVAKTTCLECDRPVRLSTDEAATVRAQAAMALMTREYELLQDAAKEDHEA